MSCENYNSNRGREKCFNGTFKEFQTDLTIIDMITMKNDLRVKEVEKVR